MVVEPTALAVFVADLDNLSGKAGDAAKEVARRGTEPMLCSRCASAMRKLNSFVNQWEREKGIRLADHPDPASLRGPGDSLRTLANNLRALSPVEFSALDAFRTAAIELSATWDRSLGV